MKKNFSTALIFSLIYILIPFFASAAELSLSPPSGSYYVDDTFLVEIIIDTQVADTDAADIHYLNYPNTYLEVQNVVEGTLYNSTATNTTNVSNGTIDFSQIYICTTPPDCEKYNGTGTLATISFKALTEGTADVTFDFASGSTTDCNVVNSGIDLLSSVASGTYTLLASTTDTNPPIITNTSTYGITEDLATISWITNESSTSQVDYGTTTSLGFSSTSSTLVANHTVNLTGLDPNTLYYYQIVSSDASNNTATTSLYSFSTLCHNCTLNTPTVEPGSPAAGSAFTVKCPADASHPDCVHAYANNDSNECTTFIDWEGNSAVFTCNAMTAGTYTAKCKSTDNTSRGCCNDTTTTTYAVTSVSDSTPPNVFNVTAEEDSTSATVTWDTNENSTSQVEYGTTTSLGLSTTIDEELVDEHVVELAGLSTSTLYYYRVKSTNASDNSTTSVLYSFITLSCHGCVLGTPVVDPTSPTAGNTFTVKCPADASHPDCIHAYANNDSNECTTFTGWDGDSAIFTCNAMDAGSYTAKCKSVKGTSRACCSEDSDTVTYSVEIGGSTPSPPGGGGGGGYVPLPEPEKEVTPDFNKDGKVNIFDLSILLSNWAKVSADHDLNKNGIVGIFDLSALLSAWTI